MFRLFSFYFLIFSCFAVCNSQNEMNNWYFGFQAGLSFSTSPPTPLTNSSMLSFEGSASTSDAAGNLLFYTNGVNIWDKTHNIMANGSGLLGNSSTTQSALIVKQPRSTNIYYVFTLDQMGNANGLRYSIVDMTLAAGLGSVTVKNNLIYAPSCEKLAAAMHCNGEDVWIISHDYNSSLFKTFLLSRTGVNLNPVISNVGSTISFSTNTAGYLKASPNGRKIGQAVSAYTTNAGWFEVFDFDNTNGIITNPLYLPVNDYPYGCAFSPDGSKFYGTIIDPPGIYQWNLCAGSNTAIANSLYTVSTGSVNPYFSPWAMQLGNDNKLYFPMGITNQMGLINNPNNLGAAMNLSLNALSVATKTVKLGLPNFVNHYNPKINAIPFTNTISCSSVSFAPSVQPSQTISGTCANIAYPTTNYFWNFGDPGSGAANSATLTNPFHAFSNTGNFSVSLVMVSQCRIDTIIQTINILSPNPTFAISGPSAICKGERATFTVNGNYSFFWNTSVSGYSISTTPSVNTVYSVTATNTLNGCKSTNSISLTVNKCLDYVNTQNTEHIAQIYPNPANDLLTVDNASQNEIEITVRNCIGQMVFNSLSQEKKLLIETKEWAKGIYFIRIKNTDRILFKQIIIE